MLLKTGERYYSSKTNLHLQHTPKVIMHAHEVVKKFFRPKNKQAVARNENSMFDLLREDFYTISVTGFRLKVDHAGRNCGLRVISFVTYIPTAEFVSFS